MSLQLRMTKKKKLYEKYKGNCQICGRKCKPFGETNYGKTFYDVQDNATVEHIIPRMFFDMFDINWIKKSAYENLTLSCLKCNNKRRFKVDINDDETWKEVIWLLQAKRNELLATNKSSWKNKIVSWVSKKKIELLGKNLILWNKN